LYHFRLAPGRGVADVVRALEGERIGVAQPNYVYHVVQAENATAAPAAAPEQPATTPEQPAAAPEQPAAAEQTAATPEQYVVQKLRLEEAHKLATGKNVLVAVLDSAIDTSHPDLDNAVVETFNAAGKVANPHGTEMVGAIAAHGRLTGVA